MDPFGGNDIFSLFEDQGMAEATTTTVPAPAPSSEASKKKASRRSTTKTESSPAPAQRSKKAKTASSGKSSTAPKSDEATVKLPTPSPSAPSPSPAPSASASTAAATDASAPSALNVSYATTEGSRPVDTFAQYQEQLVVGSTKPTKPSTPGEKTCAMQTCYPPNYDPNDPANAPPPARKEPAKTYPFTLDPFQQRSVECIEKNQSVLVSAHTSAGKTVVAEYAIALSLKMGQRVIYTSPIKALSNQKFRELQEEFGDVGLMTGDVTINPTASCLVMTTEILLNMLYRGSEVVREIAWVVFDEVHYMRDRSRGVVWEATIILLPHKCRFVFLSATIPNATEFALWVAKLHSQPCSVVYTDYRPTPLQHYIFPAAGEGLYLVLDEKGQFRDQNFQRALAVLNSANAAEGAAPPEGEKKKKTGGAGSDVYKIIKMIMEKNYQPCIVFSFSKKDCETHAVAMAKLDLCDDSEKQLITQIFSNAMQALNDDDRQLPQVVNMFPLLRRGIGVHHGGLLPILKEVVEILFQEGLLKVLFSTETFSMGLNMPARTVVFTSVNKFDGVTYRTVSSGEYIQMSGRAGRRGLDDKGIVVLMLDQQLEPPTAKEMITGAADPLHSSFHLGYNMLLNLLRVDGADLEFMLARSFFQFQQQRATPQIQAAIDELVVQRDAITVPREREVSAYCALQEELWRLRHEMRVVLNDPDYAEPFCNPGRLVRISAVIRGATPTTAPTVFDLGVDPSAASTTAVVPAAAGGKGGVVPKTEDAATKPSNPNEGRSSTVTLHGAAATALDVITRLPALAGAGIEPTRFRSGSSADFTAGMPLPVLAAALPSASTSSAAGAGGAAPTAASAAGADSDNATDGASGLAPSSDPRMTPQGQLEMDWGWGVIVNIHRKVPIPAHALFGAYKPVAPVTMQRSGPRVMPTGAVDTVIDVLLPVDPASVPNEVLAPRIERTGPAAAANVAAGRGAVIDYAALRPCPKGVVPEYVVVPVLFTAFNGLSTFRLKVQDKLEERGGRVLMGAALRQAIQRSAGEVKSDTLASLGPEPTTEKECEADAMADSRPDALPLLKPVESMKVQGKGFRALLARVSKLKRKVAAHPIHTAVDRAELVALHTNKAALTSQVDWLRAKLAEVAQDAGLRQTLHRMRRVLRTLGHVSEDGTIQTKGRVACELSTCDELVGAEMVFTGVFNELDEAQICALCSCMVFDEAHDDQPPKLPEELSGPHRRLQEIARGVGKVISESRLPLDLEKFVASFNPFMMEVLYAWVKGAKFADITKMTDAFEGTIIRVIRRLEELLRQFAAAAKSIGNTELEKKFVSSIEKLKRDIVFAASLYL